MSNTAPNVAQNPFGKEPWLAVNLSLILPGIGQIYAGKLFRGCLFVIGEILLIILGIGLLISSTGNILVGFCLLLTTIPIFIWSLFDAYRCAKRANSQNFESLRRTNRDPWFAIFLSKIILGLGHIYVRKYFTGFLLVIITVASYFLPSDTIGSLLGWTLFIISPFVAYHAYISSPVQRQGISRRSVLIISIIIIIAPLLVSITTALFIRSFVMESRYIPSEAMVPSLQKNDRLIVDKWSYHFQNPQRGEIVLFLPTEGIKKENPQLEDAFIKRVIGLPGEKVEVRGGRVYINNQPLEENYIAEAAKYQYGPVTVPSNSYFVLGDSRNNSYDSHFWGFVPRDNIFGKASKIFWPLERARSLK